jgi:hypothetical protein
MIFLQIRPFALSVLTVLSVRRKTSPQDPASVSRKDAKDRQDAKVIYARRQFDSKMRIEPILDWLYYVPEVIEHGLNDGFRE